MTRKDYILIAAALKAAAIQTADGINVFPVSGTEMHADIAGRLCRALAQDNPHFDRNRFLVAAGVQSEE